MFYLGEPISIFVNKPLYVLHCSRWHNGLFRNPPSCLMVIPPRR